jgi:ribosome-binding factor A
MTECLQGLRSASGYLRRQLAKILNIRQVPHLNFKEDRGLENVNRVHSLLKRISEGR